VTVEELWQPFAQSLQRQGAPDAQVHEMQKVFVVGFLECLRVLECLTPRNIDINAPDFEDKARTIGEKVARLHDECVRFITCANEEAATGARWRENTMRLDTQLRECIDRLPYATVRYVINGRVYKIACLETSLSLENDKGHITVHLITDETMPGYQEENDE